jgi:hypothetical protein
MHRSSNQCPNYPLVIRIFTVDSAGRAREIKLIQRPGGLKSCDHRLGPMLSERAAMGDTPLRPWTA